MRVIFVNTRGGEAVLAREGNSCINHELNALAQVLALADLWRHQQILRTASPEKLGATACTHRGRRGTGFFELHNGSQNGKPLIAAHNYRKQHDLGL